MSKTYLVFTRETRSPGARPPSWPRPRPPLACRGYISLWPWPWPRPTLACRGYITPMYPGIPSNPGDPNPGLRPRLNPGLSNISRCSPGACRSPRGRRRLPRASTSPRSSFQELKFLLARRTRKTFSRNEKPCEFCYKTRLKAKAKLININN